MLKKTRQVLAVVSILAVTALFLDFTGTVHGWLGWLARIQFLPALLALNFGVIAALVILTLLFGRLYCSVICPLGIMQDGFGWLGKRSRKNHYSYSRAHSILRYVMLALMALAIIFGIGAFVALLAPYSAYGRIVQSFLAPLWCWCNNLLAAWAESHGSYAFYTVDVWLKGGITLAVAAVTLVVLAVMAWKNGRTYCNTICPVGTVLGFLSRFSLFRPVIDTSKCNGCGLCARNCKASCIDSKNHKIDYSRCVTCFDCIGKCRQGAISYTRRRAPEPKETDPAVDTRRRRFLTATATVAATAALQAGEKTVDGTCELSVGPLYGLRILYALPLRYRHTAYLRPLQQMSQRGEHPGIVAERKLPSGAPGVPDRVRPLGAKAPPGKPLHRLQPVCAPLSSDNRYSGGASPHRPICREFEAKQIIA